MEEGPVTDLFAFVGDVARAETMGELERRYLDGVGRFVASSAAGIYVLDPFTHGAESVAARGVSDFFLSRYEESGRRQDPVLDRALSTLHAVDNRALMSPEAWAGLPVYGEVFRLHRMANLLQAPIVSDGRALGTLNFGRTAAEGAFTPAERRTADAVGRLLGIALAALRTHKALARERDQVHAALELCSDAVVVTDLARAQRRLNAAARRLLDGLADGDCALDELMVHPVRRGQATRHEASVTLSSGVPAVLAARSTSVADDPGVVISFLELVAGGAHGARAGLLAGDSLTPRERQVAELAAGGLRDQEIAAQLFLSPYTVKQYLKAVYGKLGVRSRVDLSRLAAAPGGATPSAEGSPHTPRPRAVAPVAGR
jgi:DNA-binding CsgD family transcriptional regulator/GAF domain-containing protein